MIYYIYVDSRTGSADSRDETTKHFGASQSVSPRQYTHTMRQDFRGQGTIRTTVIGSWPKPDWLFRGLPSHSGDGEGLKSGFVDPNDNEARNRATQQAINDQVAAGPDAISDGEQRRENYIYYHVQMGFNGVDFENRTEHEQRGGLERAMAPTIRGPIGEKNAGFLVEDYLLAKEAAPPGTVIVVTIPGPMTLMDTLHDSYYGAGQLCSQAKSDLECANEEKLADDLVKVRFSLCARDCVH